MKKHTTNIYEITEIGIKLKTKAKHRIRVLGVLKRIDNIKAPNSKEDWAKLSQSSQTDRTYSDTIGDSAMAKAMPPETTPYFVSFDGQIIELDRED